MVAQTLEQRLEPTKEVDSLLDEIYQTAKKSDTAGHALSTDQIIEGTINQIIEETFGRHLALETGLGTEHKDAYLQVKNYFSSVRLQLLYAAQLEEKAEPVDIPLALGIISDGLFYGRYGLMFGGLIAGAAFLVTHFVASSYETIAAGVGVVAGFGLCAASVHDSTKGENAINKANILHSQQIMSEIRTEAKEIFLAAYEQNASMPGP